MLLRMRSHKSHFSTWLVGLFFLVLMASALLSEFFQAPTETLHELGEYQTVLRSSDLDSITHLTIKNRLGSFTLSKDGYGIWQMTSPREYPATESTITQIIGALGNLKIRKIYEKDLINTSNFSLDRPQLEVTFNSKDGGEHRLQVGLVNPIDNSTYITFEKKKAIYHIDAINYPFEKLDLGQFIDTRIFSVDVNSLASFSLYRGSISKNNLQLEFDRKDNNWQTKDGKVLEPGKVEEYLKELLSLKSQIILDKQTEALKEKIDENLASPYYIITITDDKNRELTYQITWPLASLPDIKMEKRENFMISASDRKYPFLIHKDHFGLFQKRQNQFRTISIKKLFY